LRLLLLAVHALFASAVLSSAVAQNIEDYVSVQPQADWVEMQQVPAEPFEAAADLHRAYRLLDFQERISPADINRYRRYVETLHTSNGVENNSTITVTFDPSYQTVVFHDISILRDGQQLDRLDLAAFGMYRVETDRERLIYNEHLQLSLIVPCLTSAPMGHN